MWLKLSKLGCLHLNIGIISSFLFAVSGCEKFITASNLQPVEVVQPIKLANIERAQIVPDIIDAFPKSVLGVKYGSLEVKLGNILEPIETKYPPTITWNADPQKLYVLCMTDPDVPLRLYPIYREFHHWLVGNIPGAEISMGEILTDYVGAGPPKGLQIATKLYRTGLHRYIFLIYEQPGKLTFNEKHLTIRSGKGREKFSIRNFAKKYKLGGPIAGNFYLAEWDDYVPKLYKQMNISV